MGYTVIAAIDNIYNNHGHDGAQINIIFEENENT